MKRRLIGSLVIFGFFLGLFLIRGFLAARLGVDSNEWTSLWYAIQVGLWVSGAGLLNRLLRIFFWDGAVTRATGGPPPRLLVDLVTLAIYVVAITIIIGGVFGQPLTGFWATSGVVGIVMGLALRNLLADLFTGIAVNIDRPYSTGDWIQVHDRTPEQNVIGQVKEINWRTTRIRTEAGGMVVIPNGILATMLVTNFHAEGPAMRDETTLALDFSIPTARARRVLLAALKSLQESGSLLREPEPDVLVQGTDDKGVVFKLRYWFHSWDELSPSRARDAVTAAALDHLHRAGLTPAYPKEDVFHAEMPVRHFDSSSQDGRRELLSRVELLRDLNAMERERLAGRMTRHRFSEAQTVIEAGAPGSSMFLVVEGLLNVYSADPGEDGEPLRIASLSPGDCFGEMSLLTGEPRSATISAVTDSIAYEITKRDIEDLFDQRPELIERISRIVAERRSHNTRTLEAASRGSVAQDEESMTRQMLARIRSFFRAGAA